ncbi:MAG TPA: metallophosphoesterase [Nocardioidaceae bacterium]|nr:metallophosphoesterase [Nocardioidaceae bacterium]
MLPSRILPSSSPVPSDLPGRPGAHRFGRIAAAVMLGLLGGWIGLMLGGTVHHEIGPLTTSMQVLPSWDGETTVSIPPLGELVVDTHDGPLGLHARLVGVDVQEARAIMDDPQLLSGMRSQAEGDLRWELFMAALRSLIAAVVGAAALSLLALRRVRSALVGGATAGTAVLAAAAVAFATWNPASLAEPRYTGLLTSAPSVIGNADRIVNNFSVYGDELAQLVQNVTGLYTVTSQLPILPGNREVVRVLHISDLHLAPQAWDVVRTVSEKYDVDVIVDSGDITDHGSKPENRYVQEIRHLRAPYVWVRGNHDSLVTERAMRQLPNVVVLDGKVRRVAGLTFAGLGDPTFTPDKSTTLDKDTLDGYVADAADHLARIASDAGGVDVAVFHDPTPIRALDGLASVTLSGHLHYRKVRRGEKGTWLMTEGSTGGSGLRALEPGEPADIDLSVLYLDRESGDLLAYDDISLGGLGLASAQIKRQVVKPDAPSTEMVAPLPRGTSADRPQDQPSPDEPISP